jgi:hypothetical protein
MHDGHLYAPTPGKACSTSVPYTTETEALKKSHDMQIPWSLRPVVRQRMPAPSAHLISLNTDRPTGEGIAYSFEQSGALEARALLSLSLANVSKI